MTPKIVHFTQIMKSATTLRVWLFCVKKVIKLKIIFFGNLKQKINTLKPLLCKNMMHFTLITRSATTLQGCIGKSFVSG